LGGKKSNSIALRVKLGHYTTLSPAKSLGREGGLTECDIL
ncbi:hypothetical protein LCGC14_2598610, partial [marine sediment metagenome]